MIFNAYKIIGRPVPFRLRRMGISQFDMYITHGRSELKVYSKCSLSFADYSFSREIESVTVVNLMLVHMM